MIDSFLKYLQYEKRVSSNTVLAYQNDLIGFNDFLTTTFEVSNPANAEYGMIRAWVISLIESGLEPRSVNRKIACLRTYYKFLRRQEFITSDPMIKVKALKAKKRLPSFIREQDMAHMLDDLSFKTTLEGWRDKLILELFYGTGIRLSELIQLKESDVDLFSRTIKVLGKRNKERVIPFAAGLVSIIESYQAVRDAQIGKPNHPFLLVTDKGDPCYPMMINRIVKKYMQSTHTEKRSPHVLRHTYATHLLNKGAEINAVKDLLGHSSLAATQVYTHNSTEKLKKVFDQAHPKA